MQGIAVNQREVDQTGGIVYQAAEEANDLGKPLNFSIRHYEDPHVNLGRGLEELSDVPSELQFRRPGGGGYVEHDQTFCYGIAIPKEHPKEGLEAGRSELGHQLEELIEEYSSLNPFYDHSDGDIYDLDSRLQILGVGAADISEEFGNATVVRACIYPEVPSSGLYQHGSADQNIQPVENLESVRQALEEGFMEKEVSEFVSEENMSRAEILQDENGFRPAEPCFSKAD